MFQVKSALAKREAPDSPHQRTFLPVQVDYLTVDVQGGSLQLQCWYHEEILLL